MLVALTLQKTQRYLKWHSPSKTVQQTQVNGLTIFIQAMYICATYVATVGNFIVNCCLLVELTFFEHM